MTEPFDVLSFEDELTESQRAFQLRVRAFADEVIRPNIARWFEDAHFPLELIKELGRLEMLGTTLSAPGCPGRSALEYGLGAMELEAGDSGIRTFASVQGSLAMGAIARWGSADQKDEWLRPMAAGDAVGCFALTEPKAGSDPSSMRTFARVLPGGDWELSGAKRWIGMASIAHIAVVWAQSEQGIRGFLVPTDSRGWDARAIQGKLSMRVSIQCDIELESVRLPASAALPGAAGLGAALSCLSDARFGIAFGALGAARDSLNAALARAAEREQFGVPIASFQLVQAKLADMAVRWGRSALVALHLARLKDRGVITPAQISLAKLNNVRDALSICRDARSIFGGDGITTSFSPFRHAANLESVATYEGTDEIHLLAVGAALTGVSAFRTAAKIDA